MTPPHTRTLLIHRFSFWPNETFWTLLCRFGVNWEGFVLFFFPMKSHWLKRRNLLIEKKNFFKLSTFKRKHSAYCSLFFCFPFSGKLQEDEWKNKHRNIKLNSINTTIHKIAFSVYHNIHAGRQSKWDGRKRTRERKEEQRGNERDKCPQRQEGKSLKLTAHQTTLSKLILTPSLCKYYTSCPVSTGLQHFFFFFF